MLFLTHRVYNPIVQKYSITTPKYPAMKMDDFLDLYPLRTNLKEVECKSVGRKFHFLHSLNPEIFKFKFKFEVTDSKRKNAMSTRIIDETTL